VHAGGVTRHSRNLIDSTRSNYLSFKPPRPRDSRRRRVILDG
jgi:hypothetical protein